MNVFSKDFSIDFCKFLADHGFSPEDVEFSIIHRLTAEQVKTREFDTIYKVVQSGQPREQDYSMNVFTKTNFNPNNSPNSNSPKI